MKKQFNRLLLSAGVLFYFAGCASAPLPPVEEPVPAAPVAAEKEEVPQTKKIVEEVQIVSKELAYYWDGVLASYRVYKYADEGIQKLEEVLHDSDDEVQERIVYKYEDGNCRTSQTFNESGDLLNYHTYRYNSNRQVVEDAFFNSKEELQTREEYEYDEEGRKIRWEVFNGDNALLSYSLYIYEGDLNTRIENYSPSGKSMDYFVLEYTPEGSLAKEVWYTEEEDVKETKVFTYENNLLTEQTFLRGNGSVRRRVKHAYNDAGYPVEQVFLDGGGDIQERITYEYITRTRIRYEQVNRQ